MATSNDNHELLIRIDERTLTQDKTLKNLQEEAKNLEVRIVSLEKRLDVLLSKAAGAATILVTIGSFALWVLEKFLGKYL